MKTVMIGCPQLKEERSTLYNYITSECKQFPNMNEQNKSIYILTCEGEMISSVAKLCFITLQQKE